MRLAGPVLCRRPCKHGPSRLVPAALRFDIARPVHPRARESRKQLAKSARRCASWNQNATKPVHLRRGATTDWTPSLEKQGLPNRASDLHPFAGRIFQRSANPVRNRTSSRRKIPRHFLSGIGDRSCIACPFSTKQARNSAIMTHLSFACKQRKRGTLQSRRTKLMVVVKLPSCI